MLLCLVMTEFMTLDVTARPIEVPSYKEEEKGRMIVSNAARLSEKIVPLSLH